LIEPSHQGRDALTCDADGDDRLGQGQADLRQIGDWIAQDNPARAVSFMRELRDACLALSNMPRAYPTVPSRRGAQIRRKPCRSYLIFYRIGRNAVEILHIIQGARDNDRLLFPK
jgi:toxin ParE1/3/4